jgi:hypothetical protein
MVLISAKSPPNRNKFYSQPHKTISPETGNCHSHTHFELLPLLVRKRKRSGKEKQNYRKERKERKGFDF